MTIEKTLKEKAEDIAIAFLCNFIYGPIRSATSALSERISSEEQLNSVLNEEISKLKIKDKKISARFGKAYFGVAHSARLHNGEYEIVLENGKNRSALRHELYHIYRGDLETILGPIEFLLLTESRAVLYQHTGIKL